VRLLRLPHSNAARTRVEAVRASRGDWIAFLDADDYWLPQKNERQIDYLRRHPEVEWLSSDGVFVEGERVLRASWLADYLQPVREMRGDLYHALVQRCFVLTSSTLIRRSAHDAVGGMDAELLSAHDYDLWLKLAARFPGALLADRLIYYYCTPGSLSTRRMPRLLENIEVMERVRRGQPRPDARARALAGRRLTTFQWALGLTCLREGDVPAARRAFRAAVRAPGAPSRRLAALLAALLPARLTLALRGREWAREVVRRAQDRGELIEVGESEPATREEARW
jgi:hypothetical protein